jgi:hypothetical protein
MFSLGVNARRKLRKWDLMAEAAEAAAVSEETSAHAKCTKQFVPNVVKNVKYHSSQQKESLFIAKTVS